MGLKISPTLFTNRDTVKSQAEARVTIQEIRNFAFQSLDY